MTQRQQRLSLRAVSVVQRFARGLLVGVVGMGMVVSSGCAREEVPSATDKALGAEALRAASALVHAHPSRIAGVDSRQVAAYLQQQLTHPNRTATVHPFSAPQGTMVNVLYSAPKGVEPKALLVSHYDTKVGIPNFVGANDGASTTGLLIALANGTDWPVMCLLVDGEECVEEYSAIDGLHGSWFAAKEGVGGTLPVIVLDMLGDKDFTPTLSENGSTRLNGLIFRAAAEAGIPLERGGEIIDDHVPFAAYRRTVANIIDFEYGPDNCYWHTEEDTLDKLSADSLAKTVALVRYTLDNLQKEEQK